MQMEKTTRTTQFSLPAEPSASRIACKFVRDIARDMTLTADEVTDLQVAVTNAFNNALTEQKSAGEGRIALKIHSNEEDMTVNLVYKETHFPPEEFFSRS